VDGWGCGWGTEPGKLGLPGVGFSVQAWFGLELIDAGVSCGLDPRILKESQVIVKTHMGCSIQVSRRQNLSSSS
jgi:hypothetical protein